MRRLAAPLLIVGVVICAGCNESKSSSPARGSCSDSSFTAAVTPRLVPVDIALSVVSSARNTNRLYALEAPRLRSAARRLRTAVRGVKPCRNELVTARVTLLSATRYLYRAGHDLKLLAAGKRGVAEVDFLSDFTTGSAQFGVALHALRSEGVRPVLEARGGKAVYEQASCGTCHTLAAAGAKGTDGPDLDSAKPSKLRVARIVRDGTLVMMSFRHELSPEQIGSVAAFVSENAGR